MKNYSSKIQKTAGLAAAVFCLTSLTQAQIITIPTTAADARVRFDGNIASTSGNPIEVGGHGAANTGFISSYVLAFALPTLEAGQAFANANLSFTLFDFGIGITPESGLEADLYGLDRFDVSDAASAADYFSGDLDSSNTKLQDGILTSASTLGNGTFTSSAGSTSLTNWLNDQHANGAAGSFVFLRLSFNQETASSAQRFRIQPFGNNAGSPAPELALEISDLAVIPEPSAAAGLFGLIALASVVRRRR